ncbi:MAG: adenosylmethionine--8-amino-7-oxononanoate transaminase [Legionellales bacterium]|nr:adenosylmethionine--8-amino-7-oxononanoate transaminase [Legionellales bacterium]
MVNHNNLIQQDLKHIWHPCSQMKDFEQYPPLIVERAQGSYLYTDRGPIIDAISSWWCKSLGHGYPAVIDAIKEQLIRFEHVIGADTTYPLIVELGEQLAEISGLQHVFFASDGASAVEIAMKLALHASQLEGHATRDQFIALKNSYHGETLATLSISDVGLYKKPFAAFGVQCHFLQNIPYVANTDDPLWLTCDPEWSLTQRELEAIKDKACALIVEPIVQGAGGMRCYSADFLRKLATWAKSNNIYLIADEIMTGLGRTGKWLACQHAGITPDMICLSKGLTSGSMPLSCVLIDNPIYNLFYHDFAEGKSFLHSHTYSGNPLAVSAALATIKAMRAEGINEKAKELGIYMRQCFTDIAKKTGKLTNVRSIGAIIAGDLEGPNSQRIGYQIHQEALRHGALLRPLGNTLYWLPPLTTDRQTIEQLAEITQNSIEAVCF